MTTPYVTGTVSVTAGSAVVTGTGTGWQTSGLIAGEFGVDGLSVPVLSIDSNTKITLAQTWPGATASGKAYWISYDTTPGQQTVANAQRLAEYIARLDKPALAALASLVPAADKLPYFGAGGAGALFDFNATARALLAGGVLPNAQLPPRIRANTAVVTNLNTVFENGIVGAGPSVTGAPYSSYWLVKTSAWSETTQAIQRADELFGAQGSFIRIWSGGVWGVWRPSASVVVGTVAQSGGLATGAIIERGSNSNGQYTRFADGTQICFGSADLGYFNSSDLTTTKSFPASFSSNPGLSITATFDWPSGTPRSVPMYVRQNGITPSYFLGSATNPSNNNQSGDIFRVAYTAIGRWF